MRNKSTLRFLCNSFIKGCEKKKAKKSASGLLLQNLHRSNNEKIFKKEKLQDSRSIKMKIYYLGIATAFLIILVSIKPNQACLPKPPRPPVRIPIRVKVPKWANQGAQSASQAAGKFKNKVADLKNSAKVVDEAKQPLLGGSTSNTRYHRMENPLSNSKSKSLNDLNKVTSKIKKPEMRDDVSSTLWQYYSK